MSHEDIVRKALEETAKEGVGHTNSLEERQSKIAPAEESEYQKRRLHRQLDLDTNYEDPFALNSSGNTAYKQEMEKRRIQQEKEAAEKRLKQQQEIQQKIEEIKMAQIKSEHDYPTKPSDETITTQTSSSKYTATPPMGSKYQSTPVVGAENDMNDDVPTLNLNTTTTTTTTTTTVTSGTNKWSELPTINTVTASTTTDKDVSIEPQVKRRRNRWGEPAGSTTTTTTTAPSSTGMVDLFQSNQFFTDEQLDLIFPSGFTKCTPPPGYELEHADKLRDAHLTITTMSFMSTATSAPAAAGYGMGASLDLLELPPELEDIPISSDDDIKFFNKLFTKVDLSTLSPEEETEREVLLLLLKTKNCMGPKRKTAMSTLITNAQTYGAKLLFNSVLPLMVMPSINDIERHTLVKLLNRLIFTLDDLVRPHIHNILKVIQPLLLDQQYYTRIEGREIIANLAKASGLAAIIQVMRPDIDSQDDYIRNVTSRTFAIVASTLGIHSSIPFFKAVCGSKKSWEARHTGAKIIQQLAILVGNSILPHLTYLVEPLAALLTDSENKVKGIAALAVSALAESCYPNGIESFDVVIAPLWEGIRTNRGKTLAAFLKAIGYIVPLMGREHSGFYAQHVLGVVVREYTSSDEEMKRIVLKVTRQLVQTEGLPADTITTTILPALLSNYWTRRTSGDRRHWVELVETCTDIAQRVGVHHVIEPLVIMLKDEHEQLRLMALDCIQSCVTRLGCDDIPIEAEGKLVNSLGFLFQSPTSDANTSTMIEHISLVITAFGERMKSYIGELVGIIKWRLNSKNATNRQHAADFLAKIANIISVCGEDEIILQMNQIIYESLGEEYPDVLASLLNAMRSLMSLMDLTSITPPTCDIVARLTPILKNKVNEVQEAVVALIGVIANNAAEEVHQKEWVRISFDLLDLLKAQKKSVRRNAIKTFGNIAQAVGPQEVLVTLLNNLRVQDRTNRISTSVAIAIIAETCEPFTVIPGLMNEYRVPEANVQNGVLKAFSFMFEYIGEMSKDYCYAVVPLLEDALMDRDLVHRQTACSVVKNMAMGLVGLGREDVMIHLLNLIWPNIFETSAHMVRYVQEAIEAIRLNIGPTRMLQYLIQGLFHPAKRVRTLYWGMYNNMYVACQAAMVASYPVVEDDEDNDFRRWELEVFL